MRWNSKPQQKLMRDQSTPPTHIRFVRCPNGPQVSRFRCRHEESSEKSSVISGSFIDFSYFDEDDNAYYTRRLTHKSFHFFNNTIVSRLYQLRMQRDQAFLGCQRDRFSAIGCS